MNKITEKEYLANDGAFCPYCNSGDISRHTDIDPEFLISTIGCNNCDLQWKETFTLTGLIMDATP